MHPVERALHIGQTSRETANNIRIRSDAESDAFYHTRKTDIGLRHDVHIRRRAGSNVFELTFAKIGDGPPGARVNEREYLLADMSVSSFGNSQIRDASGKRRVN